MRKREGIEPRYARFTVGADGWSITEGAISGAEGHGPREPLGGEDRGTSPRQSRALGRSHGLLQGRGESGTTGTPGGHAPVYGKSDVPLGATR